MNGRRAILVRATAASALLAAGLLANMSSILAQAPSPSPYQLLAPIDLTGTWVSVVTEDWQNRMVTPKRGDFEGLPLNDAAKKIANAWMRDSRDACKAYGAPTIMRVPGRVKISWKDPNTLEIQADAGAQTRLLHFDGAPPPHGPVGLQGYSAAKWEYAHGFEVLAPAADSARQAAQARAAGGTLKVVTTNLKAGFLRKNGVPFSEEATVTEYYELEMDPRGTPWFVVTSIVNDEKYLLREFITSTNFKKESDDSKWHTTACSVD